MNIKKKYIFSFLAVFIFALLLIPEVQFVLGGVFVNIGYRFQDHLEGDFEDHLDQLDSEDILSQVLEQNKRAAIVRHVFPRSVKHPKVALLTCMDARIDTVELMGDTRRYYYTLRTAGSVIEPLQQEMLELAIKNGVKVVILTTHTDCAAEKLAVSEGENTHFSHLVKGVRDRSKMVRDFLDRDFVKEQIIKGELTVVEAEINTATGKMLVGKIYGGKDFVITEDYQ